AALSERTGAPVIVTLGPDGALLFDGGRADAVPAPAVGVVDTTGAGDTFCGALAAELAGGASLRDAVRFAVTAASLSVGAAGARAGMPRREAVTAAM
ncbi:MAG TPA: PfkB family carbohydrate kinase, partial [Solirubrobacteraceae bacterium]|nr:PfkB family carbohydrate kinase [Solirubrobacteraceae bacterium]